MAGRKKTGMSGKLPLCDDSLKNGDPCKTVASEDGRCGYHARNARKAEAATDAFVAATEPFQPESESPEDSALDEAIERVRVSDIRGQLADDLADNYHVLFDSLLDALKAERDMWVTCRECDHRQPVRLSDWGARTKAIDTLINQGLGKLREVASAKISEESLRAWAEGIGQRLEHRPIADLTTDELQWYLLYLNLVDSGSPDSELFSVEDEIAEILADAPESDAVHKLIALVDRRRREVGIEEWQARRQARIDEARTSRKVGDTIGA